MPVEDPRGLREAGGEESQGEEGEDHAPRDDWDDGGGSPEVVLEEEPGPLVVVVDDVAHDEDELRGDEAELQLQSRRIYLAWVLLGVSNPVTYLAMFNNSSLAVLFQKISTDAFDFPCMGH